MWKDVGGVQVKTGYQDLVHVNTLHILGPRHPLSPKSRLRALASLVRAWTANRAKSRRIASGALQRAGRGAIGLVRVPPDETAAQAALWATCCRQTPSSQSARGRLAILFM